MGIIGDTEETALYPRSQVRPIFPYHLMQSKEKTWKNFLSPLAIVCAAIFASAQVTAADNSFSYTGIEALGCSGNPK